MSQITPAATFPVAAPFNTNPAYSGTFIPAVWSSKMNVKFYAASTFADVSNTNWEGEVSGMGDKVIIHTAPMDLRYWAPFYLVGCHAVTPPSRMIPAQSLDPKIKNRSRLAYTLAELECKLVDPMAQGIILDTNGYLGENKGGNFFVVRDGILKTPRTLNALAGITRLTTLEIARSLGIPTEEADLQPYDVYTADEAFFTSTPYCMMPATKFNGLPVGDGKVGPVTKRLLQGWSDRVGLDIVEQALGQLEPDVRAELEQQAAE